MANTTLPQVSDGSTGRIDQTNIVHDEINELSRATGRRNIAGYLINGWTADAVTIERIRDRCYLVSRGLDGSAATSSTFIDLTSSGIGSGFAPSYTLLGTLMPDEQINPARIDVRTNSLACPTGTVFSMSGFIEVSWRCVKPWPTSLPGTAA